MAATHVTKVVQSTRPQVVHIGRTRVVHIVRPSLVQYSAAGDTGAFYSALHEALPHDCIEQSLGVEVDQDFAEAARALWGDTGLCVVEGDFTTQTPPPVDKRFNLIVSNPPYVRHHHIDPAHKQRLRKQASVIAGCDVSGLSGLYCYFLLLCHNWLSNGGYSIWLIPSEFMDVNYGSAIRRYLTTEVTLLHIHRFRPSDVQFEDALVSSTVVVFKNTTPQVNHRPRFSFGGHLLAPESESTVALSELAHARKWTLFAAGATCTSSESPKCITTLADLFDIKRGIATGANSFFIVTREFARETGIPEECLRPVLPSPRRLTETVVESDPDGYPLIQQPLAVIDSGYPEEIIRSRFPKFWDYLQHGRKQGVHETYLASRRSPWYSQERRPVAPFVCTYMGRITEDRNVFRFIWNKSKATAPNVYLLLYPKGYLKDALLQNPELYGRVWEALQSIDIHALIVAGRVYGGGLHKLEPRELGQVAGEPVLQVLGKDHAHIGSGCEFALFAQCITKLKPVVSV